MKIVNVKKGNKVSNQTIIPTIIKNLFSELFCTQTDLIGPRALVNVRMGGAPDGRGPTLDVAQRLSPTLDLHTAVRGSSRLVIALHISC